MKEGAVLYIFSKQCSLIFYFEELMCVCFLDSSDEESDNDNENDWSD